MGYKTVWGWKFGKVKLSNKPKKDFVVEIVSCILNNLKVDFTMSEQEDEI